MFTEVSLGRRGSADAIVVGQFKGEGLDELSGGVDGGGWAAWASGQPEATGEPGRCVPVYTEGDAERVILLGLGDREGFTPERMRAAAAGLGRFAGGMRLRSLSLRLEHALETLDPMPDLSSCGRAIGEAMALLSWDRRAGYRGASAPEDTRGPMTLHAEHRGLREGVERGLALGASANLARTLSEAPPNICTPAYVLAEARRLARGTDLKVTALQGKALEEERLTGLATVGAASENAPALIRIEYPGSGASARAGGSSRRGRAAKPLVLLGKTMTYDSGGLSIKVNNGMRGMKRDMDGGAAVLGAMHAIATVVRPRRPVVGLLVAAENSISDEAYRPDDVLTFRNGVTVEVTNTDAEGRLVLADGLCWACDREDPAAIVDLATLTGGVVVALGSVFAGLWCDDDGLREHLERASEASGERLWRLPHHQAYRDMMRSAVADIVNSAPVREAHPIQGAAFLSYFCRPEVPWAHLDIAGVHAVEKDDGPYIPGPTGYGVRLLAELAERF